MLKSITPFKVLTAYGRVLTFMGVCFFGCAFQTFAVSSGLIASQPASTNLGYPELNSKRLFALGMIETGNNDYIIGSAGEVSRYQLSPAVWKSYRKSWDYQNPEIAWQVARLHWYYLACYFTEKTGRAPTDFDMYVLWNTRYGYYAHKGFSKARLSPVVKERAQRFVNLVNRKD